MKKALKIAGILLGIFILLIILAVAVFRYEMVYKETEVAKFQSPDMQYTLSMQQIGEPGFPFGPVNGRFELEKEGEKINSIGFTVYDDGAGLYYNEPAVSWKNDCVTISVSGSEQEDMLYTLNYDGTNSSEKAGLWFTDEEVVELVKESYGETITLVEINDISYVFSASVSQPVEGSFNFYVEQGKGVLADNYLNEYFKYVGDCYFEKTMRNVEWLDEGVGASGRYTPYFTANGSNNSELRSFCEYICDFVEYCKGVEPFGSHPEYFQSFQVAMSGIQFTFTPSVSIEDYDRTVFYNELYELAEKSILTKNQVATMETAENMETVENMGTAESLGQDVLDYYMSIEPTCSFLMEDGMEYRMVGVDRALGSSFYVLVGTYDNGATCSFVNQDPYNGSGGEAKWLSFVNGSLGFSCLTHSGDQL